MFQNEISVLLADDEAMALGLMEERINKLEGVQVVASVTDGLAAKEYLLEHQVDMVLTDISMPVMDGLELVRFVHRFDPGCQTVIISGYGEFEYARQAMQSGVRDYLLKPVRARQLAEVIGNAGMEIRKKRTDWRRQLTGLHDALEKQIIMCLHHGASPEGWLASLGELMYDGGTVLVLEQEGETCAEKEKTSAVYRNMLRDGLPGNIILRLGYQQNAFWYLLIPTQAEYRRKLSHIPEYLNRVLCSPVVCREVEEIQSPEELLEVFRSNGSTERKRAVLAACEYMRTHLNKPLTRDLVAEKVYLTPSYFSTLFKKVTGKGFNEYLIELRINQAKSLLEQNISIREVGYAVGFRDSRYFSDIFRKMTGYLPSQYRSALLKGEVDSEEV